MNKIDWQYAAIDAGRHDWLGKRYFKYSVQIDTVVQVVVTTGKEKRGRGHLFGVYIISKQTLFSNYLAMRYAIPCKKSEYEKHFKAVVNHLK